MRGVRALPAAGLQQTTHPKSLQHSVEQELLVAAGEEPTLELA